ncbi:MAG: hypothetical protein OQK35_03135, partial [Alphaproteobacteria bacterium]|nr:hypothetical protein [Alphaproteobacteria bacterium]
MFKSLLLSLSLLTTVPALAQAPSGSPEETTDPAVEALVQKVTILTRTSILTAIPENDPLPIDLRFVSVPGVSATLTQGVTAKAYTRYVTVEGKQIGQVILSAVERDGRSEPLSSNNFTAQFDLTKPELEPTVPIEIQGNQQELAAALQRLTDGTGEEAVVRQEKDVQESDTGAGETGSNAKANPDAAAYQSPEALQTAEVAPPIIKITTEGCDIRVDLEQGYAFQQSRVETTENGTVSTGSCADGETKYPLQRSYTACADLVDLTAKTATAQYIQYYSDGGGTRQEVSECTLDTEQVFAIVEKRDSCPVFLDYGNLEAVTQAALVYVNSTNTEVQVRACQASLEVMAVPLEETTDGCSIRHDIAGGKSFRQARKTYTLNGITWQAGSCADNGTEYTHSKVYVNAANDKICSPIVNIGSASATMQYRLSIAVDGLSQYVNECTPDTSSLTVSATTDTCTNPVNWTHDVTAGISYGKERHYYTFNGTREYVNDCQDSAAAFYHQVETTGWQDHDDQLFAYPLNTVYIVAPNGRYNIKVSEVLTGAAQQPYVFTGTSTANSGEVTYEDCSKYQGVNNVENYTRPGGTLYSKVIGPATPIGPAHACNYTGGELVGDWIYATAGPIITTPGACWWWEDGKCAGRNEASYSRMCYFDATRINQRED